MRVGRVVRLLPEYEARYLRMHREIWPEVEAAIHEFGIRRYSIYLHRGLLFSYYELEDGVAVELVSRRWAENSACMRWEEAVAPMQAPLDPDSNGTWAVMEEIFHQD